VTAGRPGQDGSYWHKCEVPTASSYVCCLGQSGKHLLAMSISHFDPQQKSAYREMARLGHRKFDNQSPPSFWRPSEISEILLNARRSAAPSRTHYRSDLCGIFLVRPRFIRLARFLNGNGMARITARCLAGLVRGKSKETQEQLLTTNRHKEPIRFTNVKNRRSPCDHQKSSP
jgi:hypothetical protein